MHGKHRHIKKAMEALRNVDDYDLRLMTEEYDLQLGGTGSGTYFFHAIPHDVLDANADLQARIMTMQTPPPYASRLVKPPRQLQNTPDN